MSYRQLQMKDLMVGLLAKNNSVCLSAFFNKTQKQVILTIPDTKVAFFGVLNLYFLLQASGLVPSHLYYYSRNQQYKIIQIILCKVINNPFFFFLSLPITEQQCLGTELISFFRLFAFLAFQSIFICDERTLCVYAKTKDLLKTFGRAIFSLVQQNLIPRSQICDLFNMYASRTICLDSYVAQSRKKGHHQRQRNDVDEIIQKTQGYESFSCDYRRYKCKDFSKNRKKVQHRSDKSSFLDHFQAETLVLSSFQKSNPFFLILNISVTSSLTPIDSQVSASKVHQLGAYP